MHSTLPVILGLHLLVLALNVPMGFWRASASKFSLYWFLAIHLTIPLIIAIRISTGLSFSLVPLLIFAAIFGQGLGSRVYRWVDRTAM
ncbi:MAG: hypothetical protein ACOY9Y_12405 [Bacillota bacterium]